MKAKYHNVSLPSALIKEMDKFIEESKLSFRSRAEFVAYAVRRVLER